MRGSHNTDYAVNFYNDRVKEVMDASIMAEPFTYVPIKAGHMELVGGNALVFGKITEGEDVINPSVSVEISYENVSLNIPRIDLKVEFVEISVTNWTDYLPGIDVIYRRITGEVVISIPHIIYVNSYYYISVRNGSEMLGPLTAQYLAVAGNTYVEVIAGLKTSLIANGVDVADITIVGDAIHLFERFMDFQEVPSYEAGDVLDVFYPFTITAYILSLGYTIKYPILKCGATHGFGIVYKDRSGRQCSVIKSSVMSIYIPFYAEETNNLLETIAKLKFILSHKPPDWSESYEIVYFGNMSMGEFLQMRADDITALAFGTNRFSVGINSTITYTQAQNNRWKVPSWVWQPGDRIRLIGTINIATGVVTKYNVLYDYEIEETGDQAGTVINGEWFIIQANERPISFAGRTDILMEIYRPIKGLSITSAYGTGMAYKIVTDANGFKYHKGTVDQVFDEDGICITPAEVDNTIKDNLNLDYGRAHDGWKFLRLNYEDNPATNILPFWAESYFPSDWWDDQIVSSKLTSQGFSFLDDLSQRQQVLDERYRFGGFLITGTRTNNIAHFTYDDFGDLSKKYGDIIGLREVGYTVKVLQLHKETSIYIQRIQTFNPDGTEQFTLISKLLGTVRPMEDDFGCQHPNSIMVNGRNLYYWDNNEGALIRSAPNGQKVLSGPDYKMMRWFKDLFKWIKTSGGAGILDVNIGANNEHEEVWVTFRMGTEIYGVIFSEKQGRFVSRLNQITESYLHLGNFFAHLYHQRLWIMNIDEGQKWLYWSGLPTYAEVQVVTSIEPNKNKVFNAIAVFADHLLQSLAKYVHIPADASGSYELMETNVPILDLREGTYFGEIMKDENSPDSFVDVYDAKLNGREMRGRYCYVRLRTEEHDEKVRIDSIVVFSTLSERNV